MFGNHHKNKKKIKSAHINKKPSQIVDNRSLYNTNQDRGPPLPTDNWIDNPLLLCINPKSDGYQSTNYDKQIAIPMNTVFEFESKLFKGIAIVRTVDLPNTDKSYFKGRARKMDFTFQGRFKRRIGFDRLYTGQIFDKPFHNIPGHYLISAGMKLIQSLAPALKADINSNSPHMISPLVSAAQVFQICEPGQELVLPNEPKEDISLLGKEFENMKFTDRKSYFHNLENLKKYYFDTKHVYTLSCYTHMISPSSYSIHMLGMKWGIHNYSPSPMQIASVVLPDPNEVNHRRSSNSNDDDNVSDSSIHNYSPSPSNSIEVVNSNNNNNNEDADDDDDGGDELETILSEELQCESKEKELEEEEQTFSGGDGNLNNCEFLINLQVWHTNLVKELYHQKKQSSGGGFKKLFGSK